MSKDHKGDIKQYIHMTEAWFHTSFGDSINEKYCDEVMFGFYSPDGGTSGEMGMRWYDLGGSHGVTPRLEVFNDAWHSLAQFKDVIDALAELDNTRITAKEFCALLDRHGFTDKTERERPKHDSW